ncbi:hypothetical protein [Streptomyces sp. NPDC002215]
MGAFRFGGLRVLGAGIRLRAGPGRDGWLVLGACAGRYCKGADPRAGTP